jgi:2'-5' RNA ligase
MAAEKVRAFVAIELPDGWKAALGRLTQQLRNTGSNPVKWVAPESIHLTLKFFGDIPVNRIEAILGTLEAAAVGVTPFRIRTGNLGVFPGVRQCRVAWIGLEGDLDTLGSLQQSIEAALEPLGFPREKRTFTPHLTLVRVRDSARPEERMRFGEAFLRSRLAATEPLEVTGFSLMQSRLTPQGATYRRLGKVELTGSLI